MRKRRFLIGILACAFLFVAGSAAISAQDKKKKDDLYRQVELFSDALTIIQSDYVTDIPPKDLIYGALKGMLEALDPHSQFMDPQTYADLKIDTEGKFGGLGIEITSKDGLITVVTPIEDTPAWKAGIKSGDRIVKINSELTRDMNLTDAVKKLRGRPGEAVTLTLLRESEKRLLEIKIVRDVIKIKDIKEARMLQDGVGYIRLVEFRENTPQDFSMALESLSKQGMTSFILDLRNNPGGLLDVAVDVAGRFVPKNKLIVYTKGRKESQNLQLLSAEDHPVLTVPMVVLINEGSASGSEIVAGCLQDYKRAIIVGTTSFGKGSVQTVIPLSDGSALRLTTSKYYTPLGREIHGKGVIPDIAVEAGVIASAGDAASNQNKADQIFEEIEGANKPAAVTGPAAGSDYKTDNQLMRAVDILKAFKIYQGMQYGK